MLSQKLLRKVKLIADSGARGVDRGTGFGGNRSERSRARTRPSYSQQDFHGLCEDDHEAGQVKCVCSSRFSTEPRSVIGINEFINTYY